MKKNVPVFEAEAVSVFQLYRSEGGNAGFRIPVYQRAYDWQKENIKRLFEDILNGLYSRRSDPNSLAFLGTIILLDEDNKETSFDGRSLCIIDGQQRLTSLSLLACVIYEQIEIAEERLKILDLKQSLKDWLEAESRYQKNRMRSLITGTLSDDGIKYYPFPRIVRELEDCRAITERHATYDSALSNILFSFSTKYIIEKERGKEAFFESHVFPKEDGDAFKRNISAMIKLIETLQDQRDEDDSEFLIELPSLEDFQRKGFRFLFKKTPQSQKDEDSLFSQLSKANESIIGHLRLLAFSSFMLDDLIITSVSVTNEKYGFDIFDALNTTGEPLTAIQTFKPQVVKFASSIKNYSGSIYEECIRDIENYLNSFSGNDEQQRASKDLVISFALYKTGKKLSLHLDQQRSYLRNNFIKLEQERRTENLKRKFIQDLKNVAEYRNRFWTDNDLSNQLISFPDREKVLLCLSFLKRMKTSLVIPILCRYYYDSISQNNPMIFSDAVKALTAFVVMRRAVTGSTGGIDTDFRKLMFPGPPSSGAVSGESKPLCIGLRNENSSVSVEKFKEYLRAYLEKKIKQLDKETWAQSIYKDLFSKSKPLCRFMLLAAAHDARPKENNPFELEKNRSSPETDYLNLIRWNSEETSSIEHVAPQNKTKNSDWDSEIYNQGFVNSIGNLTLLTRAENSVLANKNWKNKKWIFRAFASKKNDDLNQVLHLAEKEGFGFSNINKDILQGGAHRPLSESIAAVDSWDKDYINNRSYIIALLVWDEISEWIF